MKKKYRTRFLYFFFVLFGFFGNKKKIQNQTSVFFFFVQLYIIKNLQQTLIFCYCCTMSVKVGATTLCDIMKECGSDKSTIHNYAHVYHVLFKHMRNKKITLFEVGIGSNNVNIPSNMGENGVPGASLKGWARYFPHANIYGADIDQDCLFKQDRISTFYVDQCDRHVIADMWKAYNGAKLDIFIDDGLHDVCGNVTLFEESQHMIKIGGFYIIEDVLNYLIPHYLKYIKLWKIAFPNWEFTLLELPTCENHIDNNLIVCQLINKN